ncbi:response regulator [Corynebacterium sp. TAE3-ERU16]|uniref:response regulator n=1 Tax=Corynebacterium sp. TAE3-ERU16 TaxID=2849493 RepID=UPI001C49146A|nr:response regulator transcription factor [Corynebacterium sp. TAE3-ERU16]
MIRVVIADDEALIRTGLATILSAAGDIEVVGEAASGGAAFTQARALRPDVVCMDIRMPDGDGLRATRKITALAEPTPAVLVVTTFDHDEYVFGALESGACGVVLKDSPMDVLVAGVRRAAHGEGLLDAPLTRRVIGEFANRRTRSAPDPGPPMAPLTPREVDCVRELCRGQSNNDIAATLYLEPSTVKTHLSNAMAKTGARGRVQLVIWAFRSRLVDS